MSVDAGTISISSDNNIGSGNVTLDGGTLKLSTAMTTDNSFSMGSSNGTIDTNGSNSTVSGVIAGSGQLAKSGTGTLTLSGNATNDAGINILEGILKVNQTVSGTTILSGGELGGIGTLATITNTSGLVAPGNSIGTLTITGNYEQSSNATLAIEFNDSGQTDKLDISGIATLDGAIEFQPEAGNYSANQTYTFIEADGGTSGTFASQSTSNSTRLGGLSIRLIYNSINVQFILDPETYTSLGFSGNKGKVASYLDSLRTGATGDFLSVLNEIDVLSKADTANSFMQIDGDIFSSSQGRLSEMGRHISNNIYNRIGLVRMKPGVSENFDQHQLFTTALQSMQLMVANQDFGQVVNSIFPYIPYSTYQDSHYGFWIKGVGSLANRDSDDNHSGYSYKSGGVSMGIDTYMTPDILVGLSSSFLVSELTINGSLGRIEKTSLYFGPYLSLSHGNNPLDISLIVGFHNNKSDRNINFTDLNRLAKSDYKTIDITASGKKEWRFSLGDNIFAGPKFSILYNYAEQNAFNETGADSLNLSIDNIKSHLLNVGIGVFVDRKGDFSDKEYHLYASIGGVHERSLGEKGITQGLVGKSKFNTDGVDKKEYIMDIQAVGEWGGIDDFTLSIGYSGYFDSRYNDHQIQLGVKSTW